jgi:hypothetical protein
MSSIFEPGVSSPEPMGFGRSLAEGKNQRAGGPNESLGPAADPRRLNGLDLFQARDFFQEQLFHPLFQGHL